MADDENTETGGWVQALIEGGVPQLLAGPAGKALSRLVGAAVEIPAARLEQKAQAIRDETEARSRVMKTLSEKSAELGLSNPELLDRGLNNLLGNAYRTQAAKESIASKTAGYLGEDPPSPTSAGPDDDWMNVFEAHAGQASSDRLQDLWARVLAGEIRTPGSFSLVTLNFLAVIDQNIAKSVNNVFGRVVDGQYIDLQECSGDFYRDASALRDYNLIRGFEADTMSTRSLNETGVAIYSIGSIAVVARGKPGDELMLTFTTITHAAKQLLPIVAVAPSQDAVDRLIGMLKSQAVVNEIQTGIFIADGAQNRAINLHTVWKRNADPPQGATP